MSRNDITGDSLTTKPPTKEFEDNYDRIFRSKSKTRKPKNSGSDLSDENTKRRVRREIDSGDCV